MTPKNTSRGKMVLGGNGARSGFRFEKWAQEVACALGIAEGKNAGSKVGRDVPIRLDKCTDCGAFVLPEMGCCPGVETIPIRTGIEAKTKNAFEAAGATFQLTEAGLVTTHPLYSKFVTAPLWEGRVPACIRKTDKTLETWKAEKSAFPPTQIDLGTSSQVAQQQEEIGCAQIQIENYGIQHTGIDVYNTGVPQFEVPTRIRIRAKQHSGSTVPSDVQATLNQKKIAPSPIKTLEQFMAAILPPPKTSSTDSCPMPTPLV